MLNKNKKENLIISLALTIFSENEDCGFEFTNLSHILSNRYS